MFENELVEDTVTIVTSRSRPWVRGHRRLARGRASRRRPATEFGGSGRQPGIRDDRAPLDAIAAQDPDAPERFVAALINLGVSRHVDDRR